MCVSVGVIEKLQQDYYAGRDLGRSVPDVDADMAAIIVAESLEADRIWNLPPKRLLSGEVGEVPKSDFVRAVVAEFMFAAAEAARGMHDSEQEGDWWAVAMATLQEVLESPTASPTLWYEDVFFDLAYGLRRRGEREAVRWFVRALAHTLRHSGGDNAMNALRDLADAYLAVDDLDAGLSILAALLRHDPADIWTYNAMALSFAEFGLIEVGTLAARRGLALLDAQGDPEKLRDQLRNGLGQMEESARQGRESEVTPSVLAELEAVLALGFDGGTPRSMETLCRELVPDLDRVPVKRPMVPADFPLPRTPVQPQISPPAHKPGRNDPCWCGSRKKYKRCHMRSDRGR
jgi:hypothetical protein